MITEFGAEASRSGPVEQPGTYEYQQKFVADHLAVHASKPYVYGSIHWALRDFRVDPTWQGGAPAGVGHAAVAQQEPDRGDERPQAGLPHGPEAVAEDAPAALAPAFASTTLRGREAPAPAGPPAASPPSPAAAPTTPRRSATTPTRAALRSPASPTRTASTPASTATTRSRWAAPRAAPTSASTSRPARPRRPSSRATARAPSRSAAALLFVEPKVDPDTEDILGDVEKCLSEL